MSAKKAKTTKPQSEASAPAVAAAAAAAAAAPVAAAVPVASAAGGALSAAEMNPSNPLTRHLHPQPGGSAALVPLDHDEKKGAAFDAKSAGSSASIPANPKKGDAPRKDAKADIKGLDDDKDSGKPLKLQSKDKKDFTVERKHAFISTLVKTSLENDDKAEEVPIPGVTGAILDLVVNYMKEHKGVEPPIIEKPLRSKVMKDVCPHKWDAEYIDRIGDTRQQLYDLILAANYMDIKSLLHLGCAKVASLIKGQPLEKIKEILDPNQGAKKDGKDGKDGKSSDGKDVKGAGVGDVKGVGAASGAAAAAATPVDTKVDAKADAKASASTTKPVSKAAAKKAKTSASSSSSAAAAAAAAPMADSDEDAKPTPIASASATSASSTSVARKKK